MLFDTHSPNRRRAVQILFGGLALLMGGGLVFFGIGADSGTGILDNVGSAQSTIKQYEKDAEAAEKKLEENPKDESAAASLAQANLKLAIAEGFDPNTGELTENGQQFINAADTAWQSYLRLGPAKPNAGLALQYASLYVSGNTPDYAKAARAVESALQTRKNSGLYGQLAILQLYAGDKTQYRLARTRALDLATSDTRRTAIREQLDDIEKQYEDAVKEQAKAAEKEATAPKIQSLPGLPAIGGGQ